MRDKIRVGLVASLDPKIVDELLEAYSEAKQKFYLGDHRPSAVEGGRFCEAAFRLLQEAAMGKVTPLGTQLDSQKTINQLQNAVGSPDSIRLHIPRALRVVYDIRNKRDNAHLADGIDPNLQDSTLVVSILDWVMAEFVRLYHGVDSDEAQSIVNEFVTRAVPVIEDFGGFLKVLEELPASDHFLVLLYQRGAEGASLSELDEWARATMRGNLKRTIRQLDEKGLVHLDDNDCRITTKGIREVEGRGLIEPD